jgi:GntR family galactonate operon transcriptional repressor
VRGSLEASMARAAAEQQTPERTAALRAAFEETRRRIDDFEAYNQADADFHYLIMEQSENRLAANITRILFARARESARFIGTPGPAAMSVTLDEHEAVLEAIVRGDADGAAQAMRDHIAKAWARRRPPNPRTGA